MTYPSPRPTIGCFPVPPPRKKGATENTNPPRLENNCTPVVDSSVCDNLNLIRILVVWADNLLMYNTLEVFLIVCGLGLCALDHRPLQ